jgi:ketosteroid isomerase-like protein
MIRLLGLALAVALAFTGCGGPSPSKVTQQFFAAVEKGDMAELRKCATAETVSTAQVFKEKAKTWVHARGGVVSAEETIIDGTKAVVTVKFKDGSKEKVDVVKVKGRWKVSVKK